MRKKVSYYLISLFVSFFLFASCVTADFSSVELSVSREDYAGARKTIESKKDSLYTENDKVLYNLDAGLLSHYAGDWNQSNTNLTNAERLIDEYYSKSISQGISSYFVNDMVVDYAGEDYEDIYTNFFMALNYVHLGKIEDAMVEIRRFDNKQKLLSTKYADQLAYAENELGPGYKPDLLQFQNSAAARYLSMLLYRTNGQKDSAEVDRKLLIKAFNEQKSLYNFDIPSCVNDELSIPKNMARLNFICFTGLAPVKVEDVERIDMGGGVYCKIATPLMVDKGSFVNSITVDIYGSSGKVLTVVEPTSEDRLSEIVSDTKDGIETDSKATDDETFEEESLPEISTDKVASIAASKVKTTSSASARARELVMDEMESSLVPEPVEEDSSDDSKADAEQPEKASASSETKVTDRSAAARERAAAMGIEQGTPKPETTEKVVDFKSSNSTEFKGDRSAAARERASSMGIEQDSAGKSSALTGSSSAAKRATSVSATIVQPNVDGLDHLYKSSLEKIESIENIAMDTFIQHSSVIYSRALIRAIGKTLKTGVLSLASGLTDDSQLSTVLSVLSFASQVTDEVTEQADLRTSRFFPANIYVGGITLEPGEYTVVVTFKGASDQVLSISTYYNVKVSAKSANIVEAMCLK